jgi:hypothetical protein
LFLTKAEPDIRANVANGGKVRDWFVEPARSGMGGLDSTGSDPIEWLVW